MSYAAIFGGYALIVFVYRWTTPKVFGADWIGLFLGQNYQGFSDAFKSVDSNSMYRPLNSYVSCLFAGAFRDHDSFFRYCLSLSLLNGLLAVLFYFVAGRILSSKRVAALATFLFLFSGPVISGCWHQLFGNSQILTILAILVGFTFYLLYSESRRWLYLVGLCLALLVAPWFRQYGALLSMCVFAVELFGKRSWPVLILAALGVAHSLQPKLILTLTGVLYSDAGSIFRDKIAAGYMAEEMKSTSGFSRGF